MMGSTKMFIMQEEDQLRNVEVNIPAPKTVRPRIGFIGAELPEFEGQRYQTYGTSLAVMRELSQVMRFDLVASAQSVKTVSDAKREISSFTKEPVDFLLIQASTFPSGEVATILTDHSIPTGLWALPEPPNEGRMHLNSFCGVNMIASIRKYYLKKQGIPPKFFFGSAKESTFQQALKVTVEAIRSIKALRQATLGLIGGVAPGFFDLAVEEENLTRKFGTRIEQIAIDSVIKRAQETHEDDVKSQLRSMMGRVENNGIDSGQLERSARIELALHQICMEKGLTILALDCWPQFQADYEVMVCAAVGGLNESGIPTACEGDVESAMGMFILAQLAQCPVTLVDLSTINEEHDAAFFWHCGAGPVSYANTRGICSCYTLCKDAFGPDFPLRDLGPGHHMVFADGPYTATRFSIDSKQMFVLTGQMQTMDLPCWTGSGGWMTQLNLNETKLSALDFANTVVSCGLQHHFPLVKGNFTAELMELTVRLELDPIKPVFYRNYLT